MRFILYGPQGLRGQGQGGERSGGQWVEVEETVTFSTPLQSSPVSHAMWISQKVAETGDWRLAEASRRPQLTLGGSLTVQEAENYDIQTRIILLWVFLVFGMGLLALIQKFTHKNSIFKDVAFIVLVVIACVIRW